MAALLTSEYVGVIVYSVRNKARPIMAMVGGIVCVVKARRTKANTMTIRVNDVIITRRLGTIARPAKIITSLTGVDQSLPVVSFVVALSMTVIRSLMLGTVFVGIFSAEVSLGKVGTVICSNGLFV